MLKIEIRPKGEVSKWVCDLPPSMAIATLLGGDRWSCVQQVTTATLDGEIVGIATIAPQGEQMSGEPTIVAIYVAKDHRNSGAGFQLLEAAVDHMISKGLVPIHVDVMNSKVLRMIDRLPAEKRKTLDVVDQSMDGALDSMMER